MSPSLKSYRVYSYDAAHHIVSVDIIEAVGDEDVVAKAEVAGFGSRCEIWDERRMVAQLSDQRCTG